MIKLKVQAGESIEKEFTGSQNIGNAWQTTWDIERCIAYAVKNMLSDQDIVSYLQEKS